MKATAVTTYLDNDHKLIREFDWLYQSWLRSGSWLTSDLVVFYHPAIPRNRLPDLAGVLCVPLTPLTAIEPEWQSYPFINSVWFLTTPEARALGNYEYVLRTDHDVFLTPHFCGFRPRLAVFGVGLYQTQQGVTQRLAAVAERFGIVPLWGSVGSTVMAAWPYVRRFSERQYELTRRLLDEEFPDGPGTWPGWFRGVASMYAGCLAAADVMQTGCTFGGLDIWPAAVARIHETDYHIHAFHTNERFSKLAWWRGEYRNEDLSRLDTSVIPDYCLWIAGDGP